jgi:hypothetical protein
MTRINLHATAEFEADLAALMKARKLRSKSEAIRLAVHEAAAPQAGPRKRDLRALIGFVERLPGGRRTARPGKDLLAEIDAEMEARIGRPARRW